MPFWAKYATATTFEFPMIKRGVVDFALTADWTPAATDSAVSKDNGNMVDTTNTVAIVGGTPTRGTAKWKLTLSTTELTCAVADVQIVDAATKAVEDQSFQVYTYGNASAKFAGSWDDIVRLGLTALPAAAAEAAGGLYTRGTGAGQIAQDANGNVRVNVDTIKTNPVVNAGTITFPTTATLASTTNITAAAGCAVSSIGTNVITATAINADAITAAKLAADVTTELQAGLATPTNITAGTITTATNVTTVNGLASGVITNAAFAADAITAAKLAADVTTELQTGLATPTNITAGIITTVTNLTNAPTNGDLTAAMKASVTIAATAATPTISTLGNNTITALAIATGAIDADALAADAVAEIQAGLYEDSAVWIDTVNGAAGTTSYVNGTQHNPCSTLASALTIATAVKLRRFRVVNGSTITLVSGYSGWTFASDGYGTIALGGQALVNVQINDFIVSGTAITGLLNFENCTLVSCTLPPDTGMEHCSFVGPITMGTAGNFYVLDSEAVNIGGTPVTFDFGAGLGSSTLNLRKFTGTVSLANMGQSGTDAATFAGEGRLEIAASCQNSTIRISGNVTVANSGTNMSFIEGSNYRSLDNNPAIQNVQTDTTNLVTRITATLFSGITSLGQWLGLLAGKQSGNATARTELRATGAGSGTYDETTDSLEAIKDGASAPSAATIADAVWDETLADHLGPGSTGTALNAAGAAGDPWSTLIPGLYGPGTAGAIVGTNLDAAISTVTSAISALNDLSTSDIAAALATFGATAPAEDYAALHAAPTRDQFLYMLLAILNERSIAATTLTAKKVDGSTPAMTFTLDSTTPTSQTRAT